MNTHCLKVALRTTIPVFLGYISCGIAFGLITINAGYPWWLAPATGILIFAGAGQFLAVPLFAARTPIPVILVTELLLNIRHIVYGLPLINQFKECRRFKPYLIYALTDEDDLEDSTLLNSALYLADRLYGESRMYMPQGIIPEIRTQWSQPIAGAGVVKDLYTAMGMVNSFLFDENFDPVYGGNSPYKGQNKVAVVVKRNIPIVRTVQRISTINSSNIPSLGTIYSNKSTGFFS